MLAWADGRPLSTLARRELLRAATSGVSPSPSALGIAEECPTPL